MFRFLVSLFVISFLMQAPAYPMAQKGESISDNINVMCIAEKKGANALLTIEVENVGKNKVKMNFASAKQYDFAIKDSSGKLIWQWSKDRLFAQGMQNVFIEPGKAVINSEEWYYKDSNGEDVKPGKYYVTATLFVTPSNITTAPQELTVLGNDLEISGGYAVTGEIYSLGKNTYIKGDDGNTYLIGRHEVDFSQYDGQYITVYSPVIEDIPKSEEKRILIDNYKILGKK